MTEQNKEDIALREAKIRFIAAVVEASPAKMIEKKPFYATGLALIAGIAAALSGRKILRLGIPGISLFLSIYKRLVG